MKLANLYRSLSLLRVERLLAAANHQAAHDVMNEIIALEREHDVALPAEFPFRFAQVAFAAGLAETAVEHVNEYLLAAGRDGEFYRAALELLDSAEEAARLADAEQRRAEAARQRAEEERQRAAARQRNNDELARRQVEAAAVPLPRDPLRSGGLAPQMVRLPTGRFQYVAAGGAESWVSIDKPFAIAKYEGLSSNWCGWVWSRSAPSAAAADDGRAAQNRGGSAAAAEGRAVAGCGVGAR